MNLCGSTRGEEKMRTQYVRAGLLAIPVVLAGCVTFDLQESMLQPNDAVIQPADKLPDSTADSTAMPGLYACPKAVAGGGALDDLANTREEPYIARYVQSNLDSAKKTQDAVDDLQSVAVTPVQQALKAMPSSLANSVVMKVVVQSTEIALAQPIRYAYHQRHYADLQVENSQAWKNDRALGTYIDSLQPALISTRDLREFRDALSEQFLRHANAKSGAAAPVGVSAAAPVGASAPAVPSADDELWDNLKIYYDTYVKGNFVDHFGNKYDKPTRSLTISDAELANTVGVLVDFIFEMVAQTPVWQAKDSATGVLTKGKKTVTIKPRAILRVSI